MADNDAPAAEDDSYRPETDALQCRFYENQYPEAEEVVMCNVTEIGEMGAYVTLLEYDNVKVYDPSLGIGPLSFIFLSRE